MLRSVIRFFTALLLLPLAMAFLARPVGAQGAIRVVWLGGGKNASHDPAAMAAVLKPVFEKAGMLVDYKANESVLHADSLKRYDVMYVYNANKGQAVDGTPDLTKSQEDALIAWVRAGHVMVGVHCANSSYLANPRYLDLFGASYTVHGDVEAYKYISIVNPNHLAMQGVSPPPAAGNTAYWDEGRVGRFTRTDTIMLARARADGKQQPWTWVRPEGQGWVYYTSSGHDQRAWNDANFQKQLVQALKWGASLVKPTGLHPGWERNGKGPIAGLTILQLGTGSFRLHNVTGVTLSPALPGAGGHPSGLTSGIYFGKEQPHAFVK